MASNPTYPTDEHLAAIREAVRRIKTLQGSEPDGDIFCVVPNREINRLVKLFCELDEMLLRGFVEPGEWFHGCPRAPLGDLYAPGRICPTHNRRHDNDVEIGR
jgi:hypothetical protein